MTPAWLIANLVAVALLTLALAWRWARSSAPGLRMFRLIYPRDLQAHSVEACLSGLGALLPRSGMFESRPRMIIEVESTHGRIVHRIGVTEDFADAVVSQFRTAMPGLRVEPLDAGDVITFNSAVELRLQGPHIGLRVDRPASVAAAILAAMQPLDEGERAVYQWVVSPQRSGVWPTLRSHAQAGPLAHALRPNREAERHDVHEAQRKLDAPLLAVTARIVVGAEESQRRSQLLRYLTGVLHIVARPHVGFRVRRLPGSWIRHGLSGAVHSLHPMTLTAAELTALAAFPLESPIVPGLQLGGARQLPPSPDLPSDGIVLGRATFPGLERDIGIGDVSNLMRHLLITAPTGAGKSTLLQRVVVQLASQQISTVLFDPKGDLVADVLDALPLELAERVIVCDPRDPKALGFNLLEAPAGREELIVDQLASTFGRLYEANFGPRSDDYLRAGAGSLVTTPGHVITDLLRLYTDTAFRRQIVSGVTDEVVLLPFWSNFERMPQWQRDQSLAPLLNKLRAVLMRTSLLRIVSQPTSSFTFDEVLASGKILLVSLGRSEIGEDGSNLFAALLMIKLWHAILARAALPSASRRPAVVVIDELSSLLGLPVPIGELAAQARGLGVGLVLAAQATAQLEPELRQQLLANTRSKLVLRMAAEDAARFAKELSPHLEAEDFLNLGPFEGYASLTIGPDTLPPVSLRTLPPPPSSGAAAYIRELSQQRYGRDADAVDAAIRERYNHSPPKAPIGRRKRTNKPK